MTDVLGITNTPKTPENPGCFRLSLASQSGEYAWLRASTEDVIAIPDLNQYLPDDGDTTEESFDGASANGDGKNESFDKTTNLQSIQGKSMPKKRATHPGGSSAGSDGESADGDEGDEGGESNESSGGNKGSKGGREGDGAADGLSGRHAVEVRSRAFLTDLAAGAYTLTVHPPKPRPTGEVFLAIAAVGDDTLPVPVRLQTARILNGKKLDVPTLGRIGPVVFPKSSPLRVEVSLSEPRRLALQVTAEEVRADAAQ